MFCFNVFSSQGLKGNSEAVSFHCILACICACPSRLPVTNKMWSLQSVKGWIECILMAYDSPTVYVSYSKALKAFINKLGISPGMDLLSTLIFSQSLVQHMCFVFFGFIVFML